MSKRVFISGSAEDREKMASELSAYLNDHIPGAEIMNAEESAPDAESRSRLLRRLIEDCSDVVVLWSSQAESSPWMQYELGLALALHKPIHFIPPDRAPIDLRAP